MNRTEIDGVAVLWDSGPEATRAYLSFGVGVREESLDTIGVTHLVQSLVLDALPGRPRDWGPLTDHDLTFFEVKGAPDEVASRVEALCRAVASLRLERLPAVAKRLARHRRRTGRGTLLDAQAIALSHRYGPCGIGLARWDRPRYELLTDREVTEHAARYFVAGNAVVQLAGPPPPGLRLPLPPGPRPARPSATPVSPDQRRWRVDQVTEIVVALHSGHGIGWAVAAQLLESRLERVAKRYSRRGWAVGDLTEVDDRRTEMVFWLTVPPGDHAAAAAAVADELRRFAEEGPTPEELAAVVADSRPSWVEAGDSGDIDSATDEVLFGWPYRDPADVVKALDALTPEAVAAMAAQWWHTALFVLPEGVRYDLPDVPADPCAESPILPDGSVLRPQLLEFARRRERLVRTADALSHVDRFGRIHTIRFDEVLMVTKAGNGRVVHGRNGCVIHVDPECFRWTWPTVRAIDAAVPGRRLLHG